MIPAYMVLLASSAKGGGTYIETSSIDGETNFAEHPLNIGIHWTNIIDNFVSNHLKTVSDLLDKENYDFDLWRDYQGFRWRTTKYNYWSMSLSEKFS